MLMAIILAIAVPTLAGVGYLALRSKLPRLAADVRGIALQTVIIMVVLLAIAGAIAGVLLTRGGQAVTDLDRQEIARQAGDYSTKALCDAAGFNWDSTSSPNVCKS